MTYELAKKLKDAGFPQSEKDDALYISEDIIRQRKFIGNVELVEHAAYFPTLSELIEACGQKFLKLSKNHLENNWYAKSVVHDASSNDLQLPSIKGSTPEEAVAKLWLSLNPPKEE